LPIHFLHGTKTPHNFLLPDNQPFHLKGRQMKITCPGCQWSAEVPDEKIPVGGVTATCRKCQTRFPVARETAPAPLPEFSCPNCGTGQAVSDACINCQIIFAKYAEKQRLRETTLPTGNVQGARRLKGASPAVIGLLTVILLTTGLIYKVEVVSACKLFFHIQPAHAKHIPRSALVVTRSNIASIFLKTGLRGATDDPVYKKLLEFGGRLYPRFDELLANPVKESGIDLAEDVYAFTEMQDGNRSRVGVLFGIRDRERFAGFLQRLKPGTPTTEAGVAILRLDGDASLYWNKSFALIYPGGRKGGGKQRALAIMAMKKEESIVSDPLKKRWLEGTDDCLVSVDLEKTVSQPDMSFLMKNSPHNQEVYRGSSLGFALNFVNGKAVFDARVSGAALLAEIRTMSTPPSKEFLESIPADNYLGFLASNIPFAPLLERFRQSNPEQYRKADEMVEKLTTSNLEQLAASFTGDLGMVLEGISRRSSENPAGRQYPGNQPSLFLHSVPKAEGSIVFGVKPDSVAVKILHRMLQEGPEAKHVKRDGKIYQVDSGNGCYLLADNGYIAISTSRDVVTGLAERKKTDRPAMPARLIERCNGALSLLELKLSPLFEALSDRQQSDTSLDQLKNHLTELRIISRLEKDRVISSGELLFRDETKNSLYQITKLAVTIAEMKRSRHPMHSGT
jgi:hypothetical protein